MGTETTTHLYLTFGLVRFALPTPCAAGTSDMALLEAAAVDVPAGPVPGGAGNGSGASRLSSGTLLGPAAALLGVTTALATAAAPLVLVRTGVRGGPASAIASSILRGQSAASESAGSVGR